MMDRAPPACVRAGPSWKQPNPTQHKQPTQVLRSVAAALAHLHSAGIAHLDVKPDNIMVGRDGAFKLGDLGAPPRSPGAGPDPMP